MCYSSTQFSHLELKRVPYVSFAEKNMVLVLYRLKVFGAEVQIHLIAVLDRQGRLSAGVVVSKENNFDPDARQYQVQYVCISPVASSLNSLSSASTSGK